MKLLSIETFADLRQVENRYLPIENYEWYYHTRNEPLYFIGAADYAGFYDFNNLIEAGLIEFVTGIQPVQRVPRFNEYPYRITDKGRAVLAEPWNYLNPMEDT